MTFSLIRSPNDTKSDEGGFTIGAHLNCIPEHCLNVEPLCGLGFVVAGKVDPDYSAVTTTSSLSTWPVVRF